MYTKLPNLVLGFHGCDRATLDRVIKNGEPLGVSDNKYDWLGNGIYFWEHSVERAHDWAKRKKNIKEPAVIGAVIDLGRCLNLTDYKSSDILKAGYNLLATKSSLAGTPLPQNRNVSGNSDLLVRHLDCAVIQQIHEFNSKNDLEPYDSVRGVFIEGGEVYNGAGFREKTHIQICVVNPNCIKGYFAPRICDGAFCIP